MIVPVKQVQRQHYAVAFGQVFQGATYPFHIPVQALLIDATGLIISHIKPVAQFVGAHQGQPPGAQMTDGPVHHNLFQPRAKGAFGPKPVQVPKGIHKGFLQHIFGLGVVPHNPQADVIHRFGVAIIQVILRPPVARFRAVNQVRDQGGVWVGRQ